MYRETVDFSFLYGAVFCSLKKLTVFDFFQRRLLSGALKLVEHEEDHETDNQPDDDIARIIQFWGFLLSRAQSRKTLDFLVF